MEIFFIGAVLFFMTVVFHELCHGLAAYWLGDPTAKEAGRLTLNPLKHIDPFWTILLPGLLFISTGGRFAIGMAKPVPVDFSRLRHPRRDMMIVAFAGPLANFILAGLLNIFFQQTGNAVVLFAIYFNLGLALFNLIPIPPLDGSRILGGLMPFSISRYYFLVEPYGFFIIMILYFTGFLIQLIYPALAFLCRLYGVPVLG